MNKLKLKSICIIGIALVVFTSLLLFISQYSNNKKFKDILNNFKIKNEEYVIKDFVYGKDNTIIQVAVTYYDKTTDTNSNVAIITNKSTGYLNLASDSEDYTFADNEKVKILKNDAVVVPLYNSKSNKIIDYQINVVEDETGTHYTVKSKERNE